MSKIYRVQDAQGDGPYACVSVEGFSAVMRRLGQEHSIDWRHPLEGGDLYAFGDHTRWAFDSIAGLELWFGYFGQHGYDWLEANGFEIAVLEVPWASIERHTRQVTYDRSMAQKVGVEPWPRVHPSEI